MAIQAEVPAQPVVRRRKLGKGLRQAGLLDAATAAFRELGYSATTTREIANRAGCSEAMIFRYFTDKRGLFDAVLKHEVDDFQRSVDAAVEELAHARFEDYLRDYLMRRVEAMLKQDKGNITVAAAMYDRELAHDLVRPIHKGSVLRLHGELDHYQKMGQIRPDANLDATAEHVQSLTVFFGTIAPVLYDLSKRRVREVVKEAAEVIARGLRAPDHAGGA